MPSAKRAAAGTPARLRLQVYAGRTRCGRRRPYHQTRAPHQLLDLLGRAGVKQGAQAQPAGVPVAPAAAPVRRAGLPLSGIRCCPRCTQRCAARGPFCSARVAHAARGSRRPARVAAVRGWRCGARRLQGGRSCATPLCGRVGPRIKRRPLRRPAAQGCVPWRLALSGCVAAGARLAGGSGSGVSGSRPPSARISRPCAAAWHRVFTAADAALPRDSPFGALAGAALAARARLGARLRAERRASQREGGLHPAALHGERACAVFHAQLARGHRVAGEALRLEQRTQAFLGPVRTSGAD